MMASKQEKAETSSSQMSIKEAPPPASMDPTPPISSLRDEVICTTCLSLPRVGMFQCENGHLICKDCIGKCKNFCPTCKKPLGKIRSILAEKIISLMPLPCKHSDRGCPEELFQDKLSGHETACEFRPVSCVDIACNAKVPFHRMLDHMAEGHEAGDFVHANGDSYTSYFIVNDEDFKREIMWISDHLTLDNRHFFRECFRSNEGLWYVWIYLLGTEQEALNYRTKAKIFLEGEELSYTGFINPLTDSNRADPAKLHSLVFPDSVAKKFCKNMQIHYSVSVEFAVKRSRETADEAPDIKTELKRHSKSAPSDKSKNQTKKSDQSSSKKSVKQKNESEKNNVEGKSDERDVKETSC